jgi:hypothetical protein
MAAGARFVYVRLARQRLPGIVSQSMEKWASVRRPYSCKQGQQKILKSPPKIQKEF